MKKAHNRNSVLFSKSYDMGGYEISFSLFLFLYAVPSANMFNFTKSLSEAEEVGNTECGIRWGKM